MGSTATGSGESFWREHVEGWRGSGGSRGEYCAAHGLSRKTFGWWAWRLDRDRVSAATGLEAGHFLPIDVAAIPAVLEEPAGDAAALRRVLTVLGR